MRPIPRQASSDVASSTTADVSTSGSTSASAGQTPTPTGTLPTAPTSSPPPSSATPASSSPASTTSETSSSPADTTSPSNTPSPTSTPPSSTTFGSATSNTSLSSSPTSLVESESESSFSSAQISPTTTTDTPASSSSQQETQTTITSAYTTFINGSSVVTSTTYPSTIPQVTTAATSSDRTAIIAASAAGGTAVIILVLSLAFWARRKRFKRLSFLNAITLKRRQARSRATLLDGDDPDPGLPPQPYSDYATPWDADHANPMTTTAAATQITLPRSILRPTSSRRSETGSGSAFREDVWPPPSEGTRLMVDHVTPAHHSDNDIGLDLRRIVDDVMGSSPAAAHYTDRSVSSMYRGSSVAETEAMLHSRTPSSSSNLALLEAAGLIVGSPTSTAPVRPSPLVQEQHQESQSNSGEHQIVEAV